MTTASAELLALEDHGLMVFYSRIDESKAAVSLVTLLETHGWKVDYVSPDDYSGWTKVVLRHAAALTRVPPAADAEVEAVANAVWKEVWSWLTHSDGRDTKRLRQAITDTITSRYEVRGSAVIDHDLDTPQTATPPVASNCAAVAAEREAVELLADATYEVRHNPNCPKRFEVRLCGTSSMVGWDQHGNIVGHGDTLAEAIAAAIRARSAAPARGPKEDA